MPMMKELLEDLQDSPPQNEEELREILAETGYDLIMTEPSGEDDDQEEKRNNTNLSLFLNFFLFLSSSEISNTTYCT